LIKGSLFGIIFFGFSSGGASSTKYNDFKFVNNGNYWSTNLGGRQASFTYFPTELELILVDDSAINLLKGKVQIDTTTDLDDIYLEGIALAQYQMSNVLNNFNVFLRNGFTGINQYDAPIIDCSDSTTFVPVIYFKKGNTTKIYMEDDCIIAEAAAHADIIRLKDRMVYGMLGIII